MPTTLSPDETAARYALLCRAVDPNASQRNTELDGALKNLQGLLDHDLTDLARRGSPDDFADIWFALNQELVRFREFCAYPVLAQKVVIGFGGAFSAGKSSLINALLGEKLLATSIDPTTTLPTYLLRGDERICALNLHRHLIELSNSEFLSLTHEEHELYGSQIGSLLHAAFRSVPNFAWDNLTFIDTPGYTKPEDKNHSERTDAKIARAQLNAANAIVWVVNAENGTISEDDLTFLASLDAAIPRLVVVSRADKKPADDITAIMALINKTMAERNLPALVMLPFSARKPNLYPTTPLFEHFARLNIQPRALRFAHNFKRQFTRYARFLDERRQHQQLQLNRFNLLLAKTEDAELQQDAEALKVLTLAENERLEKLSTGLRELRLRFFMLLKHTGDTVDITLPEPAEIELLVIESFNLRDLLVKERERQGNPAPELRKYFHELMIEADIKNRQLLVRRQPQSGSQLITMTEHAKINHLAMLLRKNQQHLADLKAFGSKTDIPNLANLLRINPKPHLPALHSFNAKTKISNAPQLLRRASPCIDFSGL